MEIGKFCMLSDCMLPPSHLSRCSSFLRATEKWVKAWRNSRCCRFSRFCMLSDYMLPPSHLDRCSSLLWCGLLEESESKAKQYVVEVLEVLGVLSFACCLTECFLRLTSSVAAPHSCDVVICHLGVSGSKHTWYLSQAPQAVLVEKKSVMWRNVSIWQIVMWRSLSTWEMWRKSIT